MEPKKKVIVLFSECFPLLKKKMKKKENTNLKIKERAWSQENVGHNEWHGICLVWYTELQR